MRKKSPKDTAEERRLRDISDYINSCFRRAEVHVEFIAFLKRNKRLFSKKNIATTLSLCDVYSRDVVMTLNQVIDEDVRTSSLFSLAASVKRPRKKKALYQRLVTLKKGLIGLVQTRNNHVGHFNTKVNMFEKGYPHIHMMYWVMRPKDTRKIIKDLEEVYWDLREELKIEGTFYFYAGHLPTDFENWLPKPR